ncbi:MAG: adenylyltransferase/cytidyltransferase family protein [Verrucomicrobiia bacterium]
MPAPILALDQLPTWRAHLPESSRLVVTNGCFDLLHVGHVRYLQAARQLGNLLLVGLNGDHSVRQLKGPSRPINPEADRAEVLAALACVDAVCIFPETRATHFLRLAQPHLYVKGGDYTHDSLHPDEKAVLQAANAEIHLLPLHPGRSTSSILQRAQATPHP